jgi:hypothetical protein
MRIIEDEVVVGHEGVGFTAILDDELVCGTLDVLLVFLLPIEARRVLLDDT